MPIHHIGYRIKGYYPLVSLALKEDTMDSTALNRIRILDFWDKHGLLPTIEAFQVSERSLRRWKASLIAQGGNIAALCKISTRPKKLRQPNPNHLLRAEILRLRTQTPNLGKERLLPMLFPFCQTNNLPIPSVSTIGRIIVRAPNKMRMTPTRINHKGQRKPLTRAPVTRKPKNLRLKMNECLAFDTIIRQRDGMKAYVVTCIDPTSRVAFAYAPLRANSESTRLLREAVITAFPYLRNSKVLTDNGSEFKGRFAKSLVDKTHWHTYPRTPKMNAHCERFNGTIQESFIDYHEDLLFTDLRLFNEKLAQWLVFYNTELPHLGTLPDKKKCVSMTNLPIPPLKYLLQNAPDCQMYWTCTVG